MVDKTTESAQTTLFESSSESSSVAYQQCLFPTFMARTPKMLRKFVNSGGAIRGNEPREC